MSVADLDTAVIPPAPGDIEEVLAERATLEYGGHRSMTLVGGFGLAALRAAALDALPADDHLPFPLVRRLGARP